METVKKVLLFLNGELNLFPVELNSYESVYAADGAWKDLNKNNIKPNYIVGDLDSIKDIEIPGDITVIETPDQDFTDFHKSLEIIEKHGYKSVDVLGGGGMSQDHYLGNLTTAHLFKDRLDIQFYDCYGTYYFAKKNEILPVNKGDIVSLYPFPVAYNVSAKGLKYPVKNLNFDIQTNNGIRNIAVSSEVKVSFDEGDLILFHQKKP